MNVLEVSHLYKTFPLHEGILRRKRGALDAVVDVSFSIRQREVVSVIGESGAGKSTLARLVMCLLKPTSGTIHIHNQEVTSLSQKELRPLRRDFQMVFQSPTETFNKRKTIADAFFELFSLYDIASSQEEGVSLAEELFRKVGLEASLFWRYPHEVSIGQLARICFAKAISTNPSLLVLDECLSSLDISVKAQVSNLILELLSLTNMSYLFISHELSYVYHLADRVLVMKGGRIVEEGAVEELFSSPQNEYTKCLLTSFR